METRLIDEYMIDVGKLLIKDCDPKKTKAFTSKYIHKLLLSPDLSSVSPQIQSKSISSFTGLSLQKLLFTRQVKYTDIVNAYHRQKQLDMNSHNSLTWSMYEEPLQKAHEIDQYLSNKSTKDPESKFPLAGFVISVKDSFYLKGSPCTSGMYINMDRVANRDPLIFKLLKQKGAVLTCRGNIPQFLVSLESNNNLFGECLNPIDKTRTSGGSSGGDAANVALGYANVGFGSDIAGSLRAPALHCGLYSLKPSNCRVSNTAMAYLFDRRFGTDQYPNEVQNEANVQMFLKVVLGCMGRSVRDIDRVMQVLCDNKTDDMFVSNCGWRRQPVLRKRLGVFRSLSLMEPSRATSRALDLAIARLKKQGYTMVELDLDKVFEECIKWVLICFNTTPYLQNIMNQSVNIRESLSRMHLKSRILSHIPNLMLRVITCFTNKTRVGKLLDYYSSARKYTQNDVFNAGTRLYKQVLSVLDKFDVDGILMPGYPTVAPQLYKSDVTQACYLMVFNFLRMPAGICPVARVQEDEQFYESKHNDPITKNLKEIMHDSLGMPLGVQIAGRAFQDEVVISIMKDLEKEYE